MAEYIMKSSPILESDGTPLEVVGELIRCKKCIQWDKFDLMPRDIDGREWHHCPHLGIDTDEYFYCRDGERKEE